MLEGVQFTEDEYFSSSSRNSALLEAASNAPALRHGLVLQVAGQAAGARLPPPVLPHYHILHAHLQQDMTTTLIQLPNQNQTSHALFVTTYIHTVDMSS